MGDSSVADEAFFNFSCSLYIRCFYYTIYFIIFLNRLICSPRKHVSFENRLIWGQVILEKHGVADEAKMLPRVIVFPINGINSANL